MAPMFSSLTRTVLNSRLPRVVSPFFNLKRLLNTSYALCFADDPKKAAAKSPEKPVASKPTAETKPSKPAGDAKPKQAAEPKPAKPVVEGKQAKLPTEAKQAKPAGDGKTPKPPVEAKSPKPAAEAKQTKQPGGDTKQTKPTAKHPGEGKAPKQASETILTKPVVEAARGVAKALGNDKIEGDLLGKLRGLAEETRREAVDLPRLRNVLSDMRIEQPKTDRPPRTEGLPANLSKSSERVLRKPRMSDSWAELKSLFGAQPLGIFSMEDMAPKKSVKEEPAKSLFDQLVELETRQLTRTFPRNAFEEQIQWTEDGKLWHFPIDNEAVWEEEATTSFADHVFVERLLNEPQYKFPKTGPVRHFMELVCNGLSKNPYMPAKEKRAIVAWFANYFKDKYAIVERAIADSEKAKAKEAATASQ